MRKRSPWRALKLVLLAVALITTAMALYVHLFERRSQDQILVESLPDPTAEIPEEPEDVEPPAQESNLPQPGAVLRRSESARDRALQQALSPENAVARLERRIEAMARQSDQAEEAMDRDLEKIRAAAQQEREATGKVLSLLLAALTSLGLHAVIGFAEEGRRDG